MAGISSNNEPSTAPQADRWFNLTLGSSFKDHTSKFCTFRYDFKPASIDKNQRGMLHKGKDNKVTVEFQNIQPGKPKVIFDGISEDHKDNDAVLFFDGQSFRLERLHRAVKRLRHNRALGESAGAAVSSAGHTDASSPPIGKMAKPVPLSKDFYLPLPGEIERIEVGDFKTADAKPGREKTMEQPSSAQTTSRGPNSNSKNDDQDEPVDIMDAINDEMDAGTSGGAVVLKELDFDINKPHQGGSDDEIADGDASDGEANRGTNAAQELRAQERRSQTSSSNSSSGSESSSSDSESGSGSGSGSSSESSDADTFSV